ncbi:hypothetical protein FACS1894164_11700 [Spirochaetia bacterium]|nr:hypothetical protein FACS1894164_11700 [Spirochaetia bacterium]
MDAHFETITNKAMQEHGVGLFADTQNCRATLVDYAEGKCQREIRRLCTLLEVDAYNQIITTQDIELTKDHLVHDMFNEYSVDRTLAREMIDFLVLVVCGKEAPVPIHVPPMMPVRSEIPVNFVKIPAGTFTMGSPTSEANRYVDEGQHQVTISKAFYMGKYEVTAGEFRHFVNASGYKTEAETSSGGYVWINNNWAMKADANWKNPYFTQTENSPVVCVSWNDAVQYCNWMNRQEGLTPAYTINGMNVTWNPNANGYRLPTEAEWEYACRGGTTTPFSTGSNVSTSQANYDGKYPYNGSAKGTYRGKTTPVGSFAANAYGLYDMHGNVWEWCWDWYGDYSRSPQVDPTGAAVGSYRVLRGGDWISNARLLRSAFRNGYTPTYRCSYLGFRVVRPCVLPARGARSGKGHGTAPAGET